MQYAEELLWILDKPGTTIHNKDEEYKENIAFVHSLGLKCDCVGWCKLNLADHRVAEIFEKISAFCKENGWKARCVYTRRNIEVESDWFELVPTDFKDNTRVDRIETTTENAEKIYTCVIRAFHEISVCPKSWRRDLFVPERFRNICIQNNDDLDFCWAKDVGKYEAEQYFHVYGKNLIPRIAVDFDIEKSSNRICSAGGWLPQIADVFHELQTIDLPDCYLAEDMPEQGIAYAHIPETFSHMGRNTILIHKNTARILLQEKAIPASALRPAPVVDVLPGGYVLKETQPIARPTRAGMDTLFFEYRKIKNTKRPVRMVTEKEALKILRSNKKARKEDFQKAIPKGKAQELLESDYGLAVPYYLVVNGGYLSDEYELLPYAQAVIENDEFQQQLDAEELLDEKPDGVVIAKCPDGDLILLCRNGFVIRFSHETPEVIDQWPSLAQFFVDAINE